MPAGQAIVEAAYNLVNSVGGLEVAGADLYLLFDIGLVLAIALGVFYLGEKVAKKVGIVK